MRGQIGSDSRLSRENDRQVSKMIPFKIQNAKVVKGAGRGKKIGVPTINLDPESVKGLEEGIYVCRVVKPFVFWGVLHFGPRPTFEEKEKTLELFLFSFGKNERNFEKFDVEVWDFIRKIKKFENTSAMIEEIGKDVETAKRKIAEIEEKN